METGEQVRGATDLAHTKRVADTQHFHQVADQAPPFERGQCQATGLLRHAENRSDVAGIHQACALVNAPRDLAQNGVVAGDTDIINCPWPDRTPGAGCCPVMDTLGSREVYRNAWMSVREDHVRHSDGSSGVFGVVDKPDFALVIPRGEHGLWMVEQYRYPIHRRAWEFPQGAGASGSDAELAAAELQEETGLQAEELRHLGYLHAAYGFCSQDFHIYVATGLHPGAPAREKTESDMQHRQVPEHELKNPIARGDVVDAPTVAAYGLLLLDELSR